MPVSLSASGYEDGLGRRSLEIDRESGVMLERLHLRPEIGAFETFLRERVAFSSTLNDDRFARICGIERDARGALTVVSQFIAGNRLCDLLDAATGLPAHEATCPSVDAALGFLLEVLPTLGTLHDHGGYAHGTLAPGRIVLTPASHVVVLDWIFGPTIQRLQFNRRKLWLDFGVAAPAAAGPSRLDVAGDLSQASLTAMMIVLGRPLRKNEYPDGLPALVGEVIEIAQIRGSTEFASSLDAFLQRTLPLVGRQPPASAAEAANEVRHVAGEIGVSKCRAALAAFVEDMNRLLAEEREQNEPAALEIEQIESPIDELTARFTSSEINFDDLSIAEPDPTVEEASEDFTAFPAVEEIALSLTSASDADVALLHDDVSLAHPIAAIDAPEPVVPESSTPEPPVAAAVPVAEPPQPMAPEPPIPVAPEPTSRIDPEAFPEPAITPEREPGTSSGFQFLDQGEPVSTRAAEPTPEPASSAPVAGQPAAPAAPPSKQSKRKRRGSKGQRDKLRSNAVQPAKPAALPAPIPASPPPIPMPTFSRFPEAPRQDAPPPAPIAVRPPAPPKAPVPLRLKTDGQTGFNQPAPRAERRDPPRLPSFLDREEPTATGAFPWRLAAAAAVGIIAVIGVGRWYIPGHNKAATETTEPAPATPPPAPKKAEAVKPGSLAVTTEPAGAHVMLDGKDVGESPVTIDGVAPGKHTLTFITSSGTVKKAIRMEAGKPLSVEVPIYSGWIAVFSPVTLDIAENGKPIGTTEQGRLMLSPGRHQLTFSNREMGYKTTQAVDIEPGEERSVSLVPTGELSANATPWAEVWLDGKKVGETPLAGLRVPLGTHEVVFKNPKFPERRVTVTVTAATPVTAAVDFNK